MYLKSFSEYSKFNESLEYCSKTHIRLSELYRVGSEQYYESFNLARKLLKENKKINLNEADIAIIEETDIGTFGLYEGEYVPLDSPMIMTESDEGKKELNKPKRGGNKKFYVYVKNDKGNIIKVEFGDPDLNVNFSDEKARKSFAARHKCAEKKDKTKPGYWSCNLPKYADSLSLSGGGNFFW